MIENILLWCLTHGQTIDALILVALIAFIAGQATQFCIDDKQKAAKRWNA